MSVPFEKELVVIAQLMDNHGASVEWRVAMLREKLLPLLQAGQAMRDAGQTPRNSLQAAWDAARERLAQLEKR